MFGWLWGIAESLRLPPRIEVPVPAPPPMEPKPFVWPREKLPPYPKNAPGDFYVENECCIACEAPMRSAPDLIEHDDDSSHCYFKKQPQTSEEIERAIEACMVSCVEAVRYRGRDPAILSRFVQLRAESACDALVQRIRPLSE